MRGKLRDKYSTNKRDPFYNDEDGARRPARRAAHANQWIEQLEEDEEDEYETYLEDEESEEEELDLDEEARYPEERYPVGRKPQPRVKPKGQQYR